jgi:predicted transcriptional regulator YdeE
MTEGTIERIANQLPGSAVYGVYTDYESDHDGEYSLLIACAVSDAGAVPDDMRAVTVPSGKYMVFTGSGEVPQVVMQTWGAVWKFFDETPKFERAYTVDFERYDGEDPSRVEIFIAIR